MRQLRTHWLGLCTAGVLLTLGAGCSNSGASTPVIPNPEDPGNPGGGQGIGIDFIPFENLRNQETDPGIVDIAFEADGDVVIYSQGQGWNLFTPGGVFKRSLQGGSAGALANNDTGRGMSYISIDALCSTAGVDDDAFVTGGHNTVVPNGAWFGGEADPFATGCSPSITSQFECPGVPQPWGYDFHPLSGISYHLISMRGLIQDNEPDGGNPCNLQLPRLTIPDTAGILAYDRRAPFMDSRFMGPGLSDLPNGDYRVYVNKSFYDQISGLAMIFPELGPQLQALRIVAFDRVYPTPLTSGTTTRSGVSVDSISDFELDATGRMIMVHPAGNTFCISEPFPEDDHMVIQRIIGGLQNGDGTGPLDFQGPRDVAIDPLSHDILLADTGHNRVVIFSSEGDYKTQFAVAGAPRVVAVDNFGRIFVVTDAGLVIKDQFGNTPIFGSIEGLVVSSLTNQPISRATVRVNYPTAYGVPNANPQDPQPNPFLSQSAETNDIGFFRFSQIVLADQLGLTASRTGFNDATVSVDVTPSQTTTVEIVMVPINTSSPGFGAISGTIQSSKSGEPVANLNVGIQGSGLSDRTNGSGEFLIVGVPAGAQTVVVSANGTTFKTVPNVQVADGQTKSLGTFTIDF